MHKLLTGAVGNLFKGKNHEEPWKQTKQIRQRGQKFRLQVHRDDQSLHPGHLHRASLATAMQ